MSCDRVHTWAAAAAIPLNWTECTRERSRRSRCDVQLRFRSPSSYSLPLSLLIVIIFIFSNKTQLNILLLPRQHNRRATATACVAWSSPMISYSFPGSQSAKNIVQQTKCRSKKQCNVSLGSRLVLLEINGWVLNFPGWGTTENRSSDRGELPLPVVN